MFYSNDHEQLWSIVTNIMTCRALLAVYWLYFNDDNNQNFPENRAASKDKRCLTKVTLPLSFFNELLWKSQILCQMRSPFRYMFTYIDTYTNAHATWTFVTKTSQRATKIRNWEFPKSIPANRPFLSLSS